MVGNITDMKKLVAKSAYNPVLPGNPIATAVSTMLVNEKAASNLAGAILRIRPVPTKRPTMKSTSEIIRKLAAVFSGVPGTVRWAYRIR
jgi:hypothetical protein